MHKNIIFFLFISFFTQASELSLKFPEEILKHIFLCADYTTRKKFKITCHKFYKFFKENLHLLAVDFCEGLDICDYIDLLHLNVNNDSFIDSELKCDQMNAFDRQAVFAIVPCGNGLGTNRTILEVGQKYLKFFFPYGQVFVVLKIFIHGAYKESLENCVVKKIAEDICAFCGPKNFKKEYLSRRYFIRILNSIEQKSLMEKEALLKKALEEKNFSNIVFLLYIIDECKFSESCKNSFYNNHSITGSNRLYNALNHEQRMLLARANCSIFIGCRTFYISDNERSYKVVIPSFIRAIENNHMNVAQSLLNIMIEQDYSFSDISNKSFNKKICENKGLFSYLLNNNACNIVEILIKNKFPLNNDCMHGATSDQIKTIVNIYCEIFSDPWDKMKNCLFVDNAVNDGDLDLVKFLLDKGADINQSIAYALKNEQMCDFFIENKKKLNLNFEYDCCIAINFRSCMDFWFDPNAEQNVIKMFDNGLFSNEYTLFSFIDKTITRDKFELCKYALNQYKKLNNDREQLFFGKAIRAKKKNVVHYLLENDFNINLLYRKNDYIFYCQKYTYCYDNNHENEIKDAISLIDDSLLINSYEKNKKDMSRDDWFLWLKCAQEVKKLDFCYHLLKNSDVGLKKLIGESLPSRTIEERINIEDRLNDVFKQKNIKRDFCHLIDKEQKHLRSIE